MSNVLTDEARYKAGKSQMGTFLSNQYLMWRIVSAKSIRKIILTADEFYTDILPEEITQGHWHLHLVCFWQTASCGVERKQGSPGENIYILRFDQ